MVPSMWSDGSSWNKWDLHVHVPGTVRANGYGPATEINVGRFCRALHDSDVAAFGLTDYFRVETCLAVRARFYELYGKTKLLLVNLEVRLAAGGAEHKADAHLIFSPELSDGRIRSIMSRLPCRYSTQAEGSREAFLADFGDSTVPGGLHAVDLATLLKAIGSEDARHVLAVVPAGKDGFTFATTSDLVRAKSAALRDRAHAVFGNPTDAARHAKERQAGGPWKGPVFAGSDCHSWEDLSGRLGQAIEGSERDSYITWIKSEVTWDGWEAPVLRSTCCESWVDVVVDGKGGRGRKLAGRRARRASRAACFRPRARRLGSARRGQAAAVGCSAAQAAAKATGVRRPRAEWRRRAL